MISWLENWAEGIMIAVIIGTIIEMIVPEGNNKKYVKTVIGVYIMFNIISPVITKFTSREVSFSLDDYESYYKKTNTYDELNKKFETTNELEIERIYKQKLNEDIEDKLSQKGYIVNNIDLKIYTKNDEQYGMIEKMNISLSVLTEENKNQANNKKIEDVVINKVNINKKQSNTEEKEIPKSKELKEYLSSEYGINTKDILINGK